MAKVLRTQIDLDFSAAAALRAEDIPYDGSNSIKDKLDALGSGGTEYIAVTGTSGTPALLQGLAATFTYTLSDFTGGAGLNSSVFNAVYVECFVTAGSGAGATISATFPDSSVRTILHLKSNSGVPPIDEIRQIIRVPVNIGQTTFVLTLAGTPAKSTTIVGVDQPA